MYGDKRHTPILAQHHHCCNINPKSWAWLKRTPFEWPELCIKWEAKLTAIADGKKLVGGHIKIAHKKTLYLLNKAVMQCYGKYNW